MTEDMGKVKDLTETRSQMEKILEGIYGEIVEVPGDVYAVVPATKFSEACRKVCAENGLNFDYIRCYTAVHREGKMELLLHLFSTTTFHKGVIKTVLPDVDPKIDSLRDLIPGAHWYEREIHEMFGIGFSGLPDDDRLLLSEDIVGFPLRKDFINDRPDWMLENSQELSIAPVEGEL